MKTNVFILGAGFSAGAGVPTMNYFIQKATEYYSQSSSHKDVEMTDRFNKVSEYIKQKNNMLHYLQMDLQNIENVYSIADMEQKINSNDDAIKATVAAIKYYIWKTIENYSPNLVEKEEKYEEYKRFIEVIFNGKSKRQNIIVTFNYDLIIEYTAMLLHKNNYGNYNFSYLGYNKEQVFLYDKNFKKDKSGLPYDNFASDPKNGKITIIKLHGSINWTKPNDPSLMPIIVPPSWRKGENESLFDQIWRGAYEYLKKATDICFIGYSLPDTDSYFKNLLALSLAESNSLQKITVINSDKTGEVKKRYEKLISPIFMNNRNGFEYLPYSFSDIKKSSDKASQENKIPLWGSLIRED